MSGRLLDSREVAEWLGLKRYQIYELVRADVLPHIRLGRSIRFDRPTLEAWLAAGGAALPGGWRLKPTPGGSGPKR